MEPEINPFALLQSTTVNNSVKGHSSEATSGISADSDQNNELKGAESGPESPTVVSEAEKVQAVDRMIQTIFLVTVDHEGETHNRGMPPHCVYLVETADSLKEETGGVWSWLGWDIIDRAVFERLMLEDPAFHVINMTSSTLPSSTEEQAAGEKDIMRYLWACHKRSVLQSKTNKGELRDYAEKCQRLVVSNAVTCLLTPELFCNQDLYSQALDLLLQSFADGDLDKMFSFLVEVVDAIVLDKDLQPSDAFSPLLDLLCKRVKENPTLSDARNLAYCSVLELFTKRPVLAQILMDHITPKNPKNAKSYEETVLGTLLSLSCLPKHRQPPEFFTTPSRGTQREHNATQEFLWQPVGILNTRLYEIFKGIFKSSTNNKNRLLNWLGNCLNANTGRGKLWSRELPNFGQVYASDSFFVNLGAVMVRFCTPFTAPDSSKILTVDLTYSQFEVKENAGEDEMNSSGVHLRDLPKETFLIKDADDQNSDAALGATQAQPTSLPYKFTTEIYFLTQRCLTLGYHSVLERFGRLNRELHHIQEVFQEMQRLGVTGQNNPTVERLRGQMDLAMSLFLSIKTALLEPQLVQHSWDLHLATARLLVQLATSENRTTLETPTLPTPFNETKAPPLRGLSLVPEFLAKNLINFLLFLRRFNEGRFEDAGTDSLEHVMSFIVTFMGCKDRMSNPHLRAKLAEVMEGLMPPKRQSRTIVTSVSRERVFLDHPLLPLVSWSLLSIYVDIEFSGDDHAFEQKFNYRRPMYHILKYIWSLEKHRKTIKEIAHEALGSMEAANPPLFLRFINLLINDAIFMLDEAMDNLKQIKEMQHQRDSGEWRSLRPHDLQQRESTLRTNGSIARFFNVMSNESMNILNFITSEIKEIFLHPVMVDRVAAMFNDFLLKLVGPKMGALKVKNFDELEFRPGSLVQHICQVYLNLGEDDGFCAAVSRDGRSYSNTLFTRADRVLKKIVAPAEMINQMAEFASKVRAMATKQEELEETFADAPEEFIDPLTFTLMSDPVTLPSSKMVMDRAVIARHLLSDQTDPFNRSPLTMEDVLTNDELRERIEAWKRENASRK